MKRNTGLRDTESPGWVCPVCGRTFRHRNQAHSHVSVSIEAHFTGKAPVVRAIYDRVLADLQEFGPIRAEAVKTSINLVRDRHIGGMRIGKNYVDLGFLLDREIRSPRIRRVEQITPRRIAHTVRLTTLEGIDAELLGWLREAALLQ